MSNMQRPCIDAMLHVRILESNHLTITRSVPVRRTWRERLLTRPWRPWVARRTETRVEPNPEILWVRVSTPFGLIESMVAHPATVARLRQQVAAIAARWAEQGV